VRPHPNPSVPPSPCPPGPRPLDGAAIRPAVATAGRTLRERSIRGRRRVAVRPALLLAAAALASCTSTLTAEERGAAVAADPGFSPSISNAFACTTCHPVRAGEGDQRLPGGPLAGASARPSYWGGTLLDLFEAVSTCYRQFMRGGRLDRDREDARALYAYLAALEKEAGSTTAAVPFTPVRTTTPPPSGDPARGRIAYAAACAHCHGPPRTGAGRLGDAAILPDATEAAHPRRAGFDEVTFRQVFVQKIRSGGFLGFTGVMPPFSREVLTDADVADIITYLDPQLR
jgi:thiosulfate dehydrogenase